MNLPGIKQHDQVLWVVLSLLTVNCLLLIGNASANTIDTSLPENYRFAQHLYDSGQFRQAAGAFEKFVFAEPDSPRVPQALYLAALSYQATGDTVASQNACERALTLNAGALTAPLHLLKSDLFKSLNATDEARITLHNLLAITDDPSFKDKALYRLAWLDIEAGRFNEAENGLTKILAAKDYSIQELQQQLGRADTIASKDPRLAGLLSVLPGGGQLYIGRYQDAAVALILNGLFFWGGIEAFDADQTALGLLLGGIGVNFYVGNIYSAVNSAHKYNRNAKNRFIEQLKATFIQTGISRRNGSPSLFASLNLPL